MKKLKLEMIVERGEDNLTGRVTINDNLIVENADNVNDLEEKLKLLLFEFENVKPESVEFEHLYDVYALFNQFDFLNIGKVADRAGINAGLLRQYASQVKCPSAKQAQKIEQTIS
ncbi:hypothetical protein ABIB40_001817 [Pedobacter sp. UYP30]|uniref:hypothetical protein n=1 Tax=Pedobacter sp. UYP30 TaxID=1756400 RepID=UPI003395FA53